MSKLQSVTLKYEGKDYVVSKEDSIWGLIEAIEDVVTFLELAPKMGSGKYPTAKIFRAYAAGLNFAGAKVTANEIREAVGYQELGEMAGALISILMMAQPGADVDLGKAQPSDKAVEKTKKKVAE